MLFEEVKSSEVMYKSLFKTLNEKLFKQKLEELVEIHIINTLVLDFYPQHGDCIKSLKQLDLTPLINDIYKLIQEKIR